MAYFVTRRSGKERWESAHLVKRLLPVLVLLAVMVFPARGVAFVSSTPVLMSPVNNAVTTGLTDPPTGTPTFQWHPVPGATQYEIQISTSAGFAQIVDSATTHATTYTPPITLGDGVYYWRVRAQKAEVWGPYSTVWSFRKDWSANGRLKPQPIEPAANAVLTGFNAGFRWTPVPGAAYYIFEIDDSPNFTSVDYRAKTLVPAHTPTQKLANATYYWRVIPVDARDHHGTAMSPVPFTLNWNFAPTLLAPEEGATLPFTPTFEWTAVPGADRYFLEVDINPNFTNPTRYETRNTSFTPVHPLSNEDYYWRVQAVDAAGNGGPFSEVRRFTRRWDYAPVLLTPTDNWRSTPHPIFRWTSVPGAYQYQIQIDETLGFAEPLKVDALTSFTTFAEDLGGELQIPGTYYWRVRALDAGGNPGPWSRTFAFSYALEMAPQPIYPPYYRTVDATLIPVHTRYDVPAPLFIWDTAHSEITTTQPFTPATHYVLEVDDSPLFTSPNFRVETAALGAAPTDDQPFTDFQYDTLYYWRVTAYIGEKQLGYPTMWIARFSPDASPSPPAQEVTPLYPADNTSWVVDAPVLGWTRVMGASKYRVQVSFTPDFSDLLHDVTTPFTNFVPGQDRTEKLPNRTYWWRVRTEVPLGDWSEPRSFRIAHALKTGNPYDYAPPNPLHYTPLPVDQVVADDNDGGTAFDLHSLWAVLDRYYDASQLRWILDLVTFASRGERVTYVIYVDTDHRSGVGAATDPQGRGITFPEWARPEYAIELHLQEDGSVSPAVVWSYSDQGWGIPQDILSLGGEITFDPALDSLQIALPYTAIGGGDADWDGAIGFAVAVFDGEERLRDVMPGDNGPNIPHFAYTGDFLNPVQPFDMSAAEGVVWHGFPLLKWFMPYWGSVDGYRVEIARDVDFTDILATWEGFENAFSYPPNYGFLSTGYVPRTPLGDNATYYWRVQLRHEIYDEFTQAFDYSPPSHPSRFSVRSLVPTHLKPEDGVTVAWTPVLQWDRVEGVGRYRVQVDDEANFSTPQIDVEVDETAYIPPETMVDRLQDGTYYWRVAIVRENAQGPWSEVHTFTKISPTPEALSPAEGDAIDHIPTLRWSAVLTPTDTPRFASARYRVELDTTPNFGAPLAFETDATSFTLPKGQRFRDGMWCWRVALMWGYDQTGPFTVPKCFYKEYPTPRILSPANGTVFPVAPSFEWEPVSGAAAYEVQIAQDENFGFPTSYETDNTRFTPTEKLAPGRWYWRVRMVDAEDEPGPFARGMFIIGYRTALPYISHP